jgi:membrane protein YqaA with SNARE-associated domain
MSKEWNAMRKSDKLLIVSIAGLAVYFVLSILFLDLASPSIALYHWMLDLSLLLGYEGAFIVALIGNSTILFPVPYMIITYILGGVTNTSGYFVFDPWIVGIIAGLGATLGEMTGYLLGYGGGRMIDESQRDSFSEYIRRHPRATPLVIWFLAITPLPDDVLIVPLGAAKYPWWKVVLPQIIGKSMFMIAVAFFGRISFETIGDVISSYNPASILSRGIEVIALLLVIVAIYLLVRIDWKELITIEEENIE